MPTGDRTAGVLSERAWRAILLFVLMAMAPVASVFAQAPLQTRTPGVDAGRVQLYPSLAVDYGYNSNILYTSRQLDESQIIGSTMIAIQPRIIVDFPFTDSHLRFGYAPLFRNYSTNQFVPSEKVSHFFDLEGEFRIGPSTMLAIRDHLVRGTQELREVDPGGGVVFGTTPFLFNDANLELRVNLGARSGFSLLPRYASTTFQSGSASSFYDYTTRGLEFRYNHTMTPAALLYLYYGSDDTDQARQMSSSTNVTIHGRRVGVGLTRTLNRVVVATASIGYATMTFDGGAPSNYSGLVLAFGTNWVLGDLTRLDLTLRQEPYQSFFANNNFYLNREIGVRVTRQIGNSILLSGGIRYNTNTYSDPIDPTGIEAEFCADPSGAITPENCPSVGAIRRDNAIYLEASVGYQIRPSLRWLIGYNHDGRATNVQQPYLGDFVDPYNYDVNRIFVRVEAGWM